MMPPDHMVEWQPERTCPKCWQVAAVLWDGAHHGKCAECGCAVAKNLAGAYFAKTVTYAQAVSLHNLKQVNFAVMRLDSAGRQQLKAQIEPLAQVGGPVAEVWQRLLEMFDK